MTLFSAERYGTISSAVDCGDEALTGLIIVTRNATEFASSTLRHNNPRVGLWKELHPMKIIVVAGVVCQCFLSIRMSHLMAECRNHEASDIDVYK